MKTFTKKTGLILTALLVSAVMVFGFVSNQMNKQSDECTTSGKCSSSEVQSKLNLKGMTRHLLDFYK